MRRFVDSTSLDVKLPDPGLAFPCMQQLRYQVEVADRGLNVTDADVIKAYVALGLGIGIIAKMAFDPGQDRNFCALDAAHLFEPSTTRIGLRRNFYLRGYVYDFISMFAPHLDRKAVDEAMSGVA
jgi:DNA-binding transcriptional LysR family regulator